MSILQAFWLYIKTTITGLKNPGTATVFGVGVFITTCTISLASDVLHSVLIIAFKS